MTAAIEVLGHNFRNNYEATVDSFGRVWQSDNDDDSNLAVRLNYILDGGNYGYLDELTGERWRAPRIGAHPFRGKAHWHQNDWYDPVIGGFRQDDIERGRIYWIAPKGHKYAAPKYDFDSAEGALRSPNYCARYLAWMQLRKLGENAEAPLAAMLADHNPRMRARALWLLGQIPGVQGNYIQRAIGDQHPEVRVVGLRLADLTGQNPIGVINQLANDLFPRVRAVCAVHLRHHDSQAAAEAWAKLAARPSWTSGGRTSSWRLWRARIPPWPSRPAEFSPRPSARMRWPCCGRSSRTRSSRAGPAKRRPAIWADRRSEPVACSSVWSAAN